MTTWTTWYATNLSKEQQSNSVLLRKLEGAYCKAKAYRSEIIEAALFIESRLEMLLCRIFIGGDTDRENLFRELILDPESCTFMQKWKMLHGVIELCGIPQNCITDKERSALFTGLKDLNSARNKFAHGYFYVDGRDESVQLRYYEQKNKTDLLNEKAVDEILNLANSLNPSMQKLIDAAWAIPRGDAIKVRGLTD